MYSVIKFCKNKKVLGLFKNCYMDILIELARNSIFEDLKKQIYEGDDVNKADYSNNGWTPLIYTSHYGRFHIVKELINVGVDINKTDNFGCTALIYASTYGYLNIVKILLEFGADIYKNSIDKHTALSIALQNGHKEIVNIIKEKMIKDIMISGCILLPHDILHKIIMEML